MHAGPFVARFSAEYTQISSILEHVHTIPQYLELLVIDHLANTFGRFNLRFYADRVIVRTRSS